MSFAQMTGNRSAVDRLRNMVSKARVPPSLLLSGPEGAGKLQAAMNLAKALNCQKAGEGKDDACDECPPCTRIDQGGYSDVRRIGPEGPGGQVKAEAVRQVVADSPFRPFEGKNRVYIFEEADRMNPTAANTLLKTLEEPPPWTVLVLLTSHEAAVLPTLLSRCQKIRFLPLSPREIADVLVEEHDAARGEASLAAAVSGGNLAKALDVLTDKLDGLREEAHRMASVPVESTGQTELISWAGKLAKAPRLSDILRLALCSLRDRASVASDGSPLYDETSSELVALTRRAPLKVWLEAYLQVEQALYDIEVRYTNKRITLEQVLVKLSDLGSKSRRPTGSREPTKSARP
jgi:DNA polymerase-3 subunit delta'